MPTTNPATPLAALDVAVIDTETTGLDVRSARIVQIGGVRMRGCEILATGRFDRLVNPGILIPKATTVVHGISDADVAAAPAYGAIADDFEAFLSNCVVVGHTIGYDLTILERETKLAGSTWTPKRALDVKLLAEIARLPVAQHDLDRLAGILGVEVEGRHTALGDALATAGIFAALVPLLKQRGIRSLAEAEAACRELTLRRQGSAGADPWPLAALPPGDPLTALSLIESFSYVHRVTDVMSPQPVWVEPDLPISDAIALMMERRISSVLVRFTDDAPGAGSGPGIATERDMLRMINTRGAAGLDARVREAATRPLLTVGQDDFVYRAVGRMERLGIRHLAATGHDGKVTGMVSARNLLRHRATTALVLGDTIEQADDEPSLARAWAMVPSAARALRAEGVGARAIAGVISAEICAITRRAAVIAERRMATAGRGLPPVPYSVLVLGSAGRGESLIAADQDNAIVFDAGASSDAASSEPGGATDLWLAEMATHMATILDAAGIPLCKGGVMAKNPQWRMSLPRFEAAIDGWVSRQRPEDILNVDIFFDGVPVSGDLAMGERLFARAHRDAQRSVTFQKMLVENARGWRSPVTILGSLRVERDGRIDLKKHGLLPIFTAGRVVAIRNGERARSTAERFRAFARAEPSQAERIERLIDAHELILGTILDQQLADADAGVTPSPRVDIKRLTPARRSDLRAAIGEVATAIDFVAEGQLV